MLEAELAWEIRAELGEGPIWWRDRLYWLDINAPSLHVFVPTTGQKQSFPLQEQTGTIVPRASGGLVLAQQTGLVAFDPESASTERLPWPADRPIVNRFNDGKCDPQGRFWVGTLGREQPIASLFRIDAQFHVIEMLTGVRVSNGLCWDELRGRFYYIDSRNLCVEAFDWEPASGTISNRRTVVRMPEGQTGVPDGMTIDTQGRLWVAFFGGYGVHCFDPDTGNSLEKISVPAANTSACWFGGKNLDELYITTAAIRVDAEMLAKYPLSGSLFVCRPSATGLPASAFAG